MPDRFLRGVLTLGGLGSWTRFPGTIASFLVVLSLGFYPDSRVAIVLFIVFTLAGFIACQHAQRLFADADPQEVRGFLDEDVAPMPVFGHGFKAHVTGSCHDARGMRRVQ